MSKWVLYCLNNHKIPKTTLTAHAFICTWGEFTIHPLSWQHVACRLQVPKEVQIDGLSMERQRHNTCPSFAIETSIFVAELTRLSVKQCPPIDWA